MNACVSHELRNPLNSIIAQNIEQSELLTSLKNILARSLQGAHHTIRQTVAAIIDKLQDGARIQGSSSEIMLFLVHDLLDFA